MTTLRDIGEDALIARLVRWAPLDPEPMAGPGDDCAVIDPGPGHERLQLLKTDALVGGIHFVSGTPGHSVGWKAAARVISDFAAMGGRPERFLVTAALPAATDVEWVEDLYRGMGECLRRHGGVLAGGETSSVPEGSAIVISVAATGSVHRNAVVLRSTGRPGDLLLVTGTLGGSMNGKHLDFMPRMREAEWLAAHHRPSAMMDLSDGLAKDLPRMATASGCGFTLQRGAVPVAPGCEIEQALKDGEDFELLLAIDPSEVPGLQVEWTTVFPELPLTVIGRLLEPGQGESLVGGWEHFISASA